MENIDKIINEIEKMKDELNGITIEILTRNEDGSYNINDLEDKIKSLKDEIKRLKKLRKQQEKMQELFEERDEIFNEIQRTLDKKSKRKHKKRH